MNYGGGAYNEALKSFARAVCGLPEVRCGTYAKLADFMDQQNAETLAAYRKGDFRARGYAGIERRGSLALGDGTGRCLRYGSVNISLPLSPCDSWSELDWSASSPSLDSSSKVRNWLLPFNVIALMFSPPTGVIQYL